MRTTCFKFQPCSSKIERYWTGILGGEHEISRATYDLRCPSVSFGVLRCPRAMLKQSMTAILRAWSSRRLSLRRPEYRFTVHLPLPLSIHHASQNRGGLGRGLFSKKVTCWNCLRYPLGAFLGGRHLSYPVTFSILAFLGAPGRPGRAGLHPTKKKGTDPTGCIPSKRCGPAAQALQRSSLFVAKERLEETLY